MQMKRLALVLLLASGCKKEDPLFCQMNPGKDGCPGVAVDAAPDDAPVGEDVMLFDAQEIFGAGAYTITLTAPPMGDLTLGGSDFNTDVNTSCLATQPADWDAAQADACIVVANNITVNGVMNVIGTRPLVLLARTRLAINGTIDLSSRRLPTPKTGPGANPASCGSPGTPGQNNGGAGGGAGGTFVTEGGDGGDGQSGTGTSALVVNDATPDTLRGGCSGGNAGDGDKAGGDGGLGGGAGYFVAGVDIVFGNNAIITACGAGATAGSESGGGGGGGSGGMIVLHAPMITAGTAVNLVANGGGGAAGASNASNGGNAQPGGDPNPLTPATPAPGGTGGAVTGGQGAILAANGQNGPDANLSGDGGAGGGGGMGFIQSNIVIPGINASPSPVQP